MQELDFDQFRVVCLVGSNGAGKSSLIEAISWCLWGKGRSKPAELMHEGSMETRVEYEFNLEQELYKVIRLLKRKKKGSPTESLEFQVFQPDNRDFVTLTEQTKTATQEKILQFIGLSYEVFMNSAFIVQGRASEFSLKHPNQRKDILIHILQIDRYNALSELAQKKALVLTKEISKTQGKIETLTDEVAHFDEITRNQQDISSRLAEAQKELSAIQTSYNKAEQRYEAFKQLGFERKQTLSDIQGLDLRLKELSEQETRKKNQLQELERLLKDSEKWQHEKTLYDKLQAEYEQQSLKAEEVRKVDAEIEAQERQLLQNELSLDAKKSLLEQNITHSADELACESSKIDILTKDLQKLKGLKEKLNSFHNLDDQVRETEQDQDTQKEVLAGLKHQISSLEQEIEEVTHNGKTIKAHNEPMCPLCHSPLDEIHKKQILQEYRQLYTQKNEKKQLLKEQLAKQEQTIMACRTKRAELQAKAEEKSRLLQDIAIFEHRQSELDHQRLQKERLEKNLLNTRQELEVLMSENSPMKQAIKDCTDQIEECKTKRLAIGFNATVFEELNARIKALSHVPQKLYELAHARENQQQVLEELEELSTKMVAVSSEKSDQEKILNSLEEKLKDEQQAQTQFSSARDTLNVQQARTSELEFQKRQLEEKIRDLQSKQDSLSSLRKSIKETSDKRDIYDFLKIAFGVTGIQSLIIENAVPELEAHANELLAKLTQNQMSLVLRTQKQLATKEKSVESLEIDISDATGTIRDYSTFSGGERFRIDLALRIALSKLLAAQSGVSVKMLIVDEGFGTQDEEGLEMIIDAIDRISDEFEKIIMITHLEKLRDAFEVKITVKKEPAGGSKFQVATAS
jgi:exonuclease SbcC